MGREGISLDQSWSTKGAIERDIKVAKGLCSTLIRRYAIKDGLMMEYPMEQEK